MVWEGGATTASHLALNGALPQPRLESPAPGATTRTVLEDSDGAIDARPAKATESDAVDADADWRLALRVTACRGSSCSRRSSFSLAGRSTRSFGSRGFRYSTTGRFIASRPVTFIGLQNYVEALVGPAHDARAGARGGNSPPCSCRA